MQQHVFSVWLWICHPKMCIFSSSSFHIDICVCCNRVTETQTSDYASEISRVALQCTYIESKVLCIATNFIDTFYHYLKSHMTGGDGKKEHILKIYSRDDHVLKKKCWCASNAQILSGINHTRAIPNINITSSACFHVPFFFFFKEGEYIANANTTQSSIWTNKLIKRAEKA